MYHTTYCTICYRKKQFLAMNLGIGIIIITTLQNTKGALSGSIKYTDTGVGKFCDFRPQ